MLTINEFANSDTLTKLNRISEFYNPEEIIMFDIETTGLSPRNSIIYLIGMNYYENGKWIISLLFNDDGSSEPEIIKTFMNKLKNYKYLIHFNGDTFDINFVSTRLEIINQKLNLDIYNYFSDVKSIDLYKLIKPYKKSLGLPNCKQKTIEEYLGINRIDEYNGGELIYVYFDYLASNTDSLKSLLLQHNHDDMEGMFYLSEIFALKALFDGKATVHDISVKKKSENIYLLINVDLIHPLNIDVSIHSCGVLINTFGNTATLRLPILTNEMKYFIPDTKDYCYIKELDTAVSKELKSDYKNYTIEKAKKSTCYIKASGYFIRSFADIDTLKSFKCDYCCKEKYIMLSDDFLGDTYMLNTYVRDVLTNLKF